MSIPSQVPNSHVETAGYGCVRTNADGTLENVFGGHDCYFLVAAVGVSEGVKKVEQATHLSDAF